MSTFQCLPGLVSLNVLELLSEHWLRHGLTAAVLRSDS